MHNSKLKRITVALCMALVPISVFAAGLGKLNVMSGLGEPLKADIELISVTAEELNSISAAIASEEAYSIQGIEKPASHSTIKVEVTKNATGKPVLKLQSAQPISEPFLDMLIQVDWSSGRLLREYTVLLDPPGYTGETDPNAQDTQTAQVPMVKSFSKNKKSNTSEVMPDDNIPADVMLAEDNVKSKKRGKRTKPVQDTEIAADASGEEYMTQRGDSLNKIAQSMRPEGVSLEQMLIGLYQTNPSAFQGNNINRLKVGQILRQPSQDTLNSISRKQAAKEVKVQAANWNAYRNKLAGIVADTAPSDSESSTQSAGGKIKTAAEDKSMSPAEGPKDVVKLSAGDAASSKGNDENIKSLQAKITALQEEATAREKSVKEAEGRTASLEKQIADMQKLLALKSAGMSDLQKQAEAQAAAEKNKPAEVATPAVEPLKPVETEAAKPEADKPVEPVKVDPPVTPVAVDAAKDKPAAKPAEVAPVEEPGFFASLTDNLDLGILAPAGGVLALLGGGWMYLRKKREKSLSDFEQGIMTSGGLKANTVFGNTASASVDTGDTSFLTDFSQSTNGGMIDTNDVDPIAEAEVYMAYGRDAQAEEILKDAISKEPKRHELHLKLLEMYAASKNLSAFETIAGELYTSLGAEDPTWAKVSEIGIKLEPNNPLYQANSAPTGDTQVSSASAGFVSTGMVEDLDASDFSDTPLAAEKDLDFSFDNESLVQDFAAESKAVAPAEEAGFELPQFDDVAAAPVESAELTAASTEVSNDALDFDMGNFGEFSAQAESTVESAVESAVDSAAVEQASEVSFGNTMPSLDMPTFDAPKFMPDAIANAGESLRDNVLDAGEAFGDKVEEATSMDALNAETFDFLQAETPQADDVAVLDISGAQTELDASEFNADTDFNFEVDTIAPEASNQADDSAMQLNTFDLNTIDLELNDGANPAELASAEAPNEAPSDFNISGNEPIEVETKLDLVAAYIEMDDKDGAKELLEEVMKEGGAGQRKRAEALLAQIA